MHHDFDEDEWERVVETRPCTSCNGDLRQCNGRCNGSFSYGMRRRTPAEVARIKSERRISAEDRILAEADAIRARRAALKESVG
jgi:hypothetical protein